MGLAAAPDKTLPVYDLMNTLDNIVDWLFYILLTVAALFIVAAAFNFITAAGDPGKLQTARDNVLYALVGVVVAFLSRGLIVLIEKMMMKPDPVETLLRIIGLS